MAECVFWYMLVGVSLDMGSRSAESEGCEPPIFPLDKGLAHYALHCILAETTMSINSVFQQDQCLVRYVNLC